MPGALSSISSSFQVLNRLPMHPAGDLPATWGAAAAFPALQSLVLDGNAIAGSLPQTWGGAGAFPVMTTLSVRNNALEGALPPTWCNAATSLPTIQVLSRNTLKLSPH